MAEHHQRCPHHGLTIYEARDFGISCCCGHIELALSDEREKWTRLVAEGIEAFRLTKEYVNIPDENGFVLLPDVEGWSHFDWVVKARAALEEES